MDIEKIVTTIDTHVGGEAFRIIQAPLFLNKEDIFNSQDVIQDSMKRLLLNEPRGHSAMNGCLILPTTQADFSVIFLKQGEDDPFKYSGAVAALTALLETGQIEKRLDKDYVINTKYGQLLCKVDDDNRSGISVTIESRECLIDENSRDHSLVYVDQVRPYLITHLSNDIPSIDLVNLIELNQWGREKCYELKQQYPHLVGMIVYEELNKQPYAVRSLTFSKDGSIVRSPGIDSTFALMAWQAHKDPGIQLIENQSIIGNSYIAKPISERKNSYFMKVRGFVTGVQQFVYDSRDPFPEGFLL